MHISNEMFFISFASETAIFLEWQSVDVSLSSDSNVKKFKANITLFVQAEKNKQNDSG